MAGLIGARSIAPPEPTETCGAMLRAPAVSARLIRCGRNHGRMHKWLENRRVSISVVIFESIVFDYPQ